MTAKVHHKCKHYNLTRNECLLRSCNKKPWDDACEEFELKDSLLYKFDKVK